MDMASQQQLFDLIAPVLLLWAPLCAAIVAVLGQAGVPLEFTRGERTYKLQAIIAVGFGIVAAVLWIAPNDPRLASLIGLQIGLTAAGLWGGTKAVAGRS